MSTSAKNENESSSAASQLGDLLFADPEKVRITEEEWAGLVHSIAAGDQHALRTLYERSDRLVYALALRITGNRGAAEQVTLDVFFDVWRQASTYHADSATVLGWMMNQTRSRAIDRRTSDGSSGGAGDCVRFADGHDHGPALQSAFATLSDDERAAIQAAFFSKLPYPDVSVQLRQPIGTISRRIRSGLKKLRRALMQE